VNRFIGRKLLAANRFMTQHNGRTTDNLGKCVQNARTTYNLGMCVHFSTAPDETMGSRKTCVHFYIKSFAVPMIRACE
jgi:hypothetical protein